MWNCIRWALFLSIGAFSGGFARAQAPQLSANMQKQINSLVAELKQEKEIPGLALAVGSANQLVYEFATGEADVENAIPVTRKTRFRTASIAKSMTAVAIMSLVDEGKLKLDAPVQDYCPEYPQKKWSVTTRQVLGHLGGVRHYKSSAETRSTRHFFSLESALSTFRDDPLRHKPGSKFLYSSFGYNLLGSVAEGASGKQFVKLLQERVLIPARMDSTVADDQYAIISNRTNGYIRPSLADVARLEGIGSLVPGRLYNAPLHDTSVKIPGGGLLSTPGDLVRFASALNLGKLVDNSSKAAMWESQETTQGEDTGYGLGWSVGKLAGRKMVSHSGGQAGTSTYLLLLPESGTSVAIMSNLQSVGLSGTAKAIAALVEAR